MATQALFQDRYNALNRKVRGWDRRLRIQQTLLWLPRSLMLGLAVGLLGEPLRLFHLIGLLLIVAGVVTAAGSRPPSDSTDDARRPRPSP